MIIIYSASEKALGQGNHSIRVSCDQVLAKIWKNWKIYTLSMRMQNGAAAMKYSMEVHKKIKNRATI